MVYRNNENKKHYSNPPSKCCSDKNIRDIRVNILTSDKQKGKKNTFFQVFGVLTQNNFQVHSWVSFYPLSFGRGGQILFLR